jgi:hypothetical protein
MFTRQALYTLLLKPHLQLILLLLVCRVSLFCTSWPGLWSSYFKLTNIARMTGAHHYGQLFFPEMEVLQTFLFCLGWHEFVILQISDYHIAKGDKCTPLCLLIGWDGISLIYLFDPGWPETVILSISASQITRIIGVGHQYQASFKVLWVKFR